MNEITALLNQWQLDEHEVRERLYRVPSPRERERWNALWWWSQGWSAAQTADALERDPHTRGFILERQSNWPHGDRVHDLAE